MRSIYANRAYSKMSFGIHQLEFRWLVRWRYAGAAVVFMSILTLSAAAPEKVIKLTVDKRHEISLKPFSKPSGSVCFYVSFTKPGNGVLVEMEGLAVDYSVVGQKIAFKLRWVSEDKKTRHASWALSRGFDINRRYRIRLGWSEKKAARLYLNSGITYVSDYRKNKHKMFYLAPTFSPKKLVFGPGIDGQIRDIRIYDGECKSEPFVGVHFSSSFDGDDYGFWKGAQKAPIKIVKGAGGAFGSTGFLRVGPFDYKYIGVCNQASCVAEKDTWIAFSARKKNGGNIKLQIANRKLRKNVSKRFSLPGNNSWKTFFAPLSWLKIDAETLLAGISFYRGNRNRESISFDIDNLVIASGKPKNVIKPIIPTLTFANDAVSLKWNAPNSLMGIARYEVYRGLYSAFPRNKRHLVGTTEKTIFIDDAFAHDGEYYYVVRCVDFAGNESGDGENVMINTNEY